MQVNQVFNSISVVKRSVVKLNDGYRRLAIVGIYQDSSCSKTLIDHTVSVLLHKTNVTSIVIVSFQMQLVGYGKTETGELYWICKNSWGKSGKAKVQVTPVSVY
jgi:hypothetical protein